MTTNHSTNCPCGICKPIAPDAQALAELTERNRLAQNATTAKAVAVALGRDPAEKGTAKLARDLDGYQSGDTGRTIMARQYRNLIERAKRLASQQALTMGKWQLASLPYQAEDVNNSQVNHFYGLVDGITAHLATAQALMLVCVRPADFTEYASVVGQRAREPMKLAGEREIGDGDFERLARAWFDCRSAADYAAELRRVRADQND